MAENNAQPDAAGHEQFAIQRLYVKDLSFESPKVPEVFQERWQPQMNVELHTETRQLAEGVNEVTLSLTVTVTNNDKTAFLAEVKQAGIFTLKGFEPAQIGHMLGSFCPNILFPYAREAITDLVSRGGFPPLYLNPVNFDALYAEHLRRAQEGEQPAEGGTAH